MESSSIIYLDFVEFRGYFCLGAGGCLGGDVGLVGSGNYWGF